MGLVLDVCVGVWYWCRYVWYSVWVSMYVCVLCGVGMWVCICVCMSVYVCLGMGLYTHVHMHVQHDCAVTE